MSSSSTQRAPSSFFGVGHHGFVKAAAGTSGSPSGSADDLHPPEPSSRARDPSPMSKKLSSFGLNVLKKRSGPQPPQQQQQQEQSHQQQQRQQHQQQYQQHAPQFSSYNTGRPVTPVRPLPPNDVSPKSYSPNNYPPHPNYAPPQVPRSSQEHAFSGFEQRGRDRPFSAAHARHPSDQLVDPLADLPMPPRIPGGVHTRDSSTNRSSSMERPGSSAGSLATDSRPTTPSEEKGKKKRSIAGGKLHKRAPSDLMAGVNKTTAFLMGPNGRGDSYDLKPLIQGQRIPELWDPEGNLLVYLYDRAPQPSFRLSSSIIASSRGLQSFIGGGGRGARYGPPGHKMRNLSLGNPMDFSASHRRRNASVGSADAPWSPSMDDESQDLEVRLPIMIDPNDPAPEEIADLLTARNMFACLVGQLIVGSPSMPTFFHIFMGVANMMKRFQFSNFDGSTMGEAAEAAFLGYVADLRLDDVRKSREKTIEALILGERMKCWSLYNEAYVHAVGKYKDILDRADPKLMSVSQRTRTAIEKSASDLEGRIFSVRERLDDFQFHGLFAGFAQSRTTKQAVDIPAWENAWKAMRKHVMSFYKKAYGNWPPKAKSKKNDFEESGLNRLLLQDVYRDFTDLYDMLVNRSDLTERTLDATHEDNLSDDVALDHLRKLLSEFDRSLVPVRPPIPFDLPLLPALDSTVVRGYDQMEDSRKESERQKKLKGDNFTSLLMNSYNRDSMKTTHFTEAFMAWERSIGHGRSASELANIRVGAWVFVYVVLQMLPLLVVDAPGLRHTRGIEYFLCEVPKGSPPWMPEQKAGKVYYRVAGTGGIVSMPADVVEHGVEGIFRRSHCWVAASKWTGQDAATFLPGAVQQPAAGSRQASLSQGYAHSAHHSDARSVSGHTNSDYGTGFAPPPTLTADGIFSATADAGSARNSRNSILPGLEALPVPPTLAVDGIAGSRRASTYDPTKSFDDILSGLPNQEGKGKKKHKK